MTFPATVSGTVTSGGIPYFSAATTLSSSALLAAGHVLLGGGAGGAPTSDAALDDGQTTANTLTYTGTAGITAAAFQTNATTPGKFLMVAGTGSIPTLAANSAGFAAPVTAGTSYLIKMPATITAGIVHLAAPATGDGVNESAMTSSAVNLASADVTGNLPNANLATQTANTVLGALTATTPSGLAVPSCSGAGNSLIWTSGTGFGCTVANTTFTTATTAVSANACDAAATTVTMTGLTTAMTITITPTTDVSGTTGWSPAAAGQLYFTAWPSAANTLSYKRCNPTGTSITPAAVTWNVSAR